MTAERAASNRVSRRAQRFAATATLFVIALVAAGYVSNSLTTRACERSTAQWLEQLFEDNGWTGTRATDRATLTWPWIVSVDYEYVIGPTGGEWGTWRYLCVFGIAIPLQRVVELQS